MMDAIGENESATPNNRQRRACVMCGIEVKSLSQHLSRVHKIKEKKRRMFFLHQARKIQPIHRSTTPKNRRPRRDCPLDGCAAASLARLENHLLSVHKMKRGAPEYMEALANARTKRKKAHEQTTTVGKGDGTKLARFHLHFEAIFPSEESADGVLHQIGRLCSMAGGTKLLLSQRQEMRPMAEERTGDDEMLPDLDAGQQSVTQQVACSPQNSCRESEARRFGECSLPPKPRRKRRLFSLEDKAFLQEQVSRRQKEGEWGSMRQAIREIYDSSRERLGKYNFQAVYDKVRHSCMWE